MISPIEKTGVFLIDRFCLSGHIVFVELENVTVERPDKCVIVVDVRHVKCA